MADSQDILKAFLSGDGGGAAAAPSAPNKGAAPSASADLLKAFVSTPSASGAQNTAESFAPTPGASPMTAIAESPLGIVDRALLGWQRTPQAQKKMLEDSFGDKNVQFIGQGDKGGFVVKQDGKWFQVDPHFEWKLSGKGAAAGAAAGALVGGVPGALAGGLAGAVSPSFMDSTNLKDLGKDVANFAGEYGIRAAGATAGAAQGGAAGAAIGAVGGPLGAGLGGVIGSIAGAGVGAATGDAVETAAKAAGAARPESVPQNTDELGKQLAASFMFGAQGEALGQGIKLGTKGAIKALSKAVDAFRDTPTGRDIASGLLSTLSGQPKELQAIRVNDPRAMIKYDSIAAEDAVNRTDKLYGMMKSKVEDAYNTFLQRKRVIGAGYNAIDDVAKGVDFQPKEAADSLIQNLTENGYMRDGKVVNAARSPLIERDITPSEKGVLAYLGKQANTISDRLSTGKAVSYDEMKNLISTTNNYLFESDKVSDPNLRRILREFSDGLNNHLSSQLPTETAIKLGELNKKWGPIKDLMDELAKAKGDKKVDAFINSVVKQDGKFNSELMSSISDLTGSADPTEEILRMHVARGSTKLWGGKKLMGVPVGSPKAAAMLSSGFSTSKGAVTELGSGVAQSIPYMAESLNFLKGLNQGDRLRLLTDEKYAPLFFRTIGNAVTGEKAMSEELNKRIQEVAQ